MKKILVIMDARRMDKRVIEFACFMARLTHCDLTGVFIQEDFFDLPYSPEPANVAYAPGKKEKVMVKKDTVSRDIDEAIGYFADLCRQKGVNCDIYQDSGKPLDEVIRESRFADLLILDPKISFSKNGGAVPTRFVKEVLTGAECPVIIAPGNVDGIDEVVFCYDATPSSVLAIKLFTYLFPEFSGKKATLLQVNPPGEEGSEEEQKRMMAWLSSHYPAAGYRCLQGDVKKEIAGYFFMKSRIMVVMGAYGRSMLSDMLRHSTAEELMRMADLPLFIAHG